MYDVRYYTGVETRTVKKSMSRCLLQVDPQKHVKDTTDGQDIKRSNTTTAK